MARKRRDPLRAKLDRLAEKIADEALAPDGGGPPLTFSQKANALKIAGAYYAVSRKSEKAPDEPSAWDEYHRRIAGNGRDHDAEEDAASAAE